MTEYDFYGSVDENVEPSQRPGGAYATSLVVAAALAILTVLEFFIAGFDEFLFFSSNVIPLVVIALLKAALIVNYYMHITRIWTTEEDGH
jgi:cytochrome c oxidase subunit IV